MRRFWGNYASRSLVSARPLYPVDDAGNRVLSATAFEILSRLILEIPCNFALLLIIFYNKFISCPPQFQ